MDTVTRRKFLKLTSGAVAVGAAVVAVALTPSLPAGIPILLAAAVALLVGGLNLFKKRNVGGDQA